MNWIKNLLVPTRFKRILFFLFFDSFIVVFSFFSAFYLRFGFTFPQKYYHLFWLWVTGLLIFKIILLVLFGLYNINWRFVGLAELLNLLKIGCFSIVLIYVFNLIIRRYWPGVDLQRGIVVIDSFISFFLISFLRISKRISHLLFRKINLGKHVLIIGADFTGERLIKELLFERDDDLIPTVIIDENELKIGTKINGIPVFGGYDKIPEVIDTFDVDCVLINLPRASHKQIGQLFEHIYRSGITDIKVVPKIDEYGSDFHKLKDFKQLGIEDLLSRESVKIDFENIKSYLREKTVLVTGAGGSIGTEIVKQLIQFDVKRVVTFEIDETEVFNQERDIEVLKKSDQEIDSIIGDIRDRAKLKQVFENYKPEIIFHAAACKHVPMMERFPDEAVKTNILGTMNLVEMALTFHCEKLINISTDKAVNPTSVMGATKRMAEIICRNNSGNASKMVSVRFGNVLGSRGSVINIFLDQIKRGGPIKVTHKDMKRYFMSIPEAVQLVFQAAYMGRGGEVFVLDMGRPVRIVDLAEKLILLNKLKPYKDIDIEFVGIRPGEKLFEELLTAEEGTDVSTHKKIYVAKNGDTISNSQMDLILQDLKDSLNDSGMITKILKKNVPFYKNNNLSLK